MDRVGSRRPSSAALFLMALLFWAATYLVQTFRIAIEEQEPVDPVKIQRIVLTTIGAAAYLYLLAVESAQKRSLRNLGRVAGVLFAVSVLPLTLRILIGFTPYGDPAELSQSVKWVLVWLGLLLPFMAIGSWTLKFRTAAPEGPTHLHGRDTVLFRRAGSLERSTSFPSESGIARTGSQQPLEDPRRIALVLSGLGAGGAEHVASMLANEWSQRRTVSIISFDQHSLVPYYHHSPQVKIHRLGLTPRRVSLPLAAVGVVRRVNALRHVLKSERPDVIVSFLTRPNVLTLVASAGLGTPVIVSERSNPELQSPGPIWSWLRLHTYPRAFALVTMTVGAKRFFPFEIQAKTRVIPNPVKPRMRTQHPNPCILAAVGRLEPVKGFDLLIRAFAGIAEQFPAWRLVIWGEGTERERLEALIAKLGLTDRVFLPGLTKVPGAWLDEADAFVLSSHYEGWPNALIEAMAAGMPVVATSCCWGPTEMIEPERNGLLVPPGDAQALSNALSRVLRSASLRERLGAAAQIAAARYEPGRVFQSWETLLKDASLTGAGRDQGSSGVF